MFASDTTFTPLASSYMNRLQSDMHLAMIERTAERTDGWQVHLLKRFFSLNHLPHPASLGTFAWSSAPIKTKWLQEVYARNFGGGYMTPGDMARDYLALKYPKRRTRVTTSNWQACCKPPLAQPPLYCVPGQMEHGVYVDLSGAYWQIVRAVGWDVSYNPGKFLSVNSSMRDWPYPYEKMARNCLVSVGLTAPMRMWTGSKIVFVKKPNRFINLVLWRLVQDVLNGAATDAIRAGAAYVYTDGYLVGSENLPAVCQMLDLWGLQYTFKHDGQTNIKAPAAYQCGDYETKQYRRNRRPHAINKVYDPGVNWLRWRFEKFARRATEDWELSKGG